MRVWIAATVLLCSGLAIASGQPPQTTGQQSVRPEQAVQHQQQPTNAPQATKEDQRGSEQTPLVVKVYKAQENGEIAKQEQEDRSERASADWRMYWIGVFTLSILIVQAGVFIWQGGQLRKTVAAMQIEYAATHRPRIRVRRIDHVFLVAGQPITAKIQAANVGETDATIVGLGIDIFFRYEATGQGEFNAVPKPKGPITVPPGADAMIDVTSGTLTQSEVDNFQAGAIELCAIGLVNYKDAAGIARNTSFFRIYSRKSDRFIAAPEDPHQGDREYED